MLGTNVVFSPQLKLQLFGEKCNDRKTEKHK